MAKMQVIITLWIYKFKVWVCNYPIVVKKKKNSSSILCLVSMIKLVEASTF